ncbi:probable aspartic proteinase GIP2 [Lotus japonicus]|uniref:probable aspartic proteinase GIP2 n=1 Tax=Lotus japonicus TaxID=34305 RepID=UPI002589D699|nr:probable aspartic proteinase GIP2 [Lotus japonicus]
MASSSSAIHCFLLLSIALFSVCHFPTTSQALKIIPRSFILPIKKDPATNLFYTSLGVGTPRQNFNLAIDLAGETLWYESDTHYNSSSYRPIQCGSKRCTETICANCSGPFKPGCTNNTCLASTTNTLSKFIFGGTLGEDTIFFSKFQLPGLLAGYFDTDKLSPFFIGDNSPFFGLPKTTKGIIGLARSQLALPLQLAEANKLPAKFSLCLPSSSNKQGFTNLLMNHVEEHYKSVEFQTTPLIVNPVATGAVTIPGGASQEYFIDVKSVLINGNVLNLKPSMLSIDKKGNGGTKISTISAFTELQSSVYRIFIREYLKAASDSKLKRVAAVAPFEACYDSTTIFNTLAGLNVPTIDLVMQGGAQWKILGANAMVMVKKNVACLAIVDGGTEPRMSAVKASIVVGAHQLEDNLLVFDLASSKLSFSSTLLLYSLSCSSSS